MMKRIATSTAPVLQQGQRNGVNPPIQNQIDCSGVASRPQGRGGSLVDEHFCRFDDDPNGIARLQAKLFRRRTCDGGDEFQVADGDDNLSHDTAEFHRLDGPSKLIPGTEHDASRLEQ
jgi:hypothetical protein